MGDMWKIILEIEPNRPFNNGFMVMLIRFMSTKKGKKEGVYPVVEDKPVVDKHVG